MTEQYWKFFIEYKDGMKQQIFTNCINLEREFPEDDFYIFRSYDTYTPPQPNLKISYRDKFGIEVEMTIPPFAANIRKVLIQGDIWWLETNGERSSAYFDKLELALQLKTEEDEIKGGFVTTENPNK